MTRRTAAERPLEGRRSDPRIIFEDAALIVVDKPAGQEMHGGTRSLLDWARARGAPEAAEGVCLVHRLDRETSGVVMIARRPEAAATLAAALRERRARKVYLALVSPVPSRAYFEVDQRLEARPIEGGERMCPVERGGQEAQSEVEVLGRGRRLALVKVVPAQGRKHQVRVALASSGSPIAGDWLYGGSRARRLARRVMLHAWRLELAHPTSGEHMSWLAPVPPDFQALLAADGGRLPVLPGR